MKVQWQVSANSASMRNPRDPSVGFSSSIKTAGSVMAAPDSISIAEAAAELSMANPHVAHNKIKHRIFRPHSVR